MSIVPDLRVKSSAGRNAKARRLALGLGASLLATGLAIAVRWWLDPLLGNELALVTLYGAIMFAVWIGGTIPAVVVAAGGYIACNYLFIEPRGSLAVPEPGTWVGLLAYAATDALIICFGVALWVARRVSNEIVETLRTTLASIGDAVITTDAHGRVTFLNPTAEALTGWNVDDASGKALGDVFRVIDEATRAPASDPVAMTLESGEVIDLEKPTLLIARDGRERAIDDSAAPIRDEAGRTTGAVLVFRDVTDKRATEEELRRRDYELTDFFDNASVGLHRLDQHGVILRANVTELDILGYGADEYVGHQIDDFYVDRAESEDIRARLLRGETIRNRPAKLRANDGSTKHVLIDSSGFFENEAFVHSRGFMRDVTELHYNQRAQSLLAAIVESSDDAIVSKSLDGIVTSWNAGAERIFGYAAEEIIGKPIDLIIPPELEHEEVSILKRLRNGERIVDFETVRVAKSGRRIDVSLTISPLRDSEGKLFGASKLARDVSERKRTDAELRESEQRFRSMTAELRESERRFRLLADNMSQFAWMADSTGWVFWYNQRWYEYTGTRLEEMQGWGWRNVHHPDYVDDVVARLQHSWDTGEVWEDTFPLRGKDGGYRWFLSRALPIRDNEGKVVRWFGTNTDVTEQRAAEEALKEADRRKDEFLATLAHELRNPLAPIANVLEILKLRGGNKHDRTLALRTVDRQLGHLTRLVDDLLDVDRITRGKIALHRERVELATVIQQAVETCGSFVEGSRLPVVELPDKPLYLNADSVRLAQAFGNLLNNAAKYTAPDGEIFLRAGVDGGCVTVVVEDTGIGIPPESLSRIFDLFEQVDDSPERAQQGLGVGLTLVKRLVEMHNGSIEASSEGHGRGSRFIVRLPVMQPDAVPLPSAAAGGREPQTRRILVVDDNEDSAASLAMLLRIKGHETHTANDGLTALSVAAQVRPDVMLLDIGLPHKDGYEVCREIRRKPWGRRIVMIAVTGWGQDEDRRQSNEAGFDAHLIKPMDYEALRALLATGKQGDSWARSYANSTTE